MAEEISITEAQNILERLVHERKALAKGLDVASRLANIEQTIQERQDYLDNLGNLVEQKRAEFNEVDTHISDTLQRREAACVAREGESAANLAAAKATLEQLQKTHASLKESYSFEIEDLLIKRSEASDSYMKTITELQEQIKTLRTELGNLNARARLLAGA